MYVYEGESSRIACATASKWGNVMLDKDDVGRCNLLKYNKRWKNFWHKYILICFLSYINMKTPERWRTSRDPCCKVPSPQSPIAMMDRHTQTNGSDSNTLTAYYIYTKSHFMISRTRTQISCMQKTRACARVKFMLHFVYQGQWLYSKHPSETVRNHVFWPGDLELWPWPSNSASILWRCIPIPKFMSLCQMVQPGDRWITDTQTDTHTHTHTPDWFYYLDRVADAGGKNVLYGLDN